MGIIISSTNAPHDTFQQYAPRAASFNVCLSKHALGFALIWAISATSIAFAGEVTTSTNGMVGPLAPVLSTKVIVQGSDNQEQTESFVFEVPKAGKAVLRIVNGAKKGAALSERVQGMELTLNDKIIVNPKSFSDKTDILETRVLVKGTNRLEIRLLAQPDQRVAVRIDAPADEIIVAPVKDIVLRSEPLLARATVTGLGLPVPDAQVQFEVRGLGPIIDKNATTSNSGIAIAYMSGFDAGRGKLHAASGAELSDLVPFTVIKKRVITVRQHPESVTVEQRPESVTLEAEAPDRLVLSKPIISPSRIAPGPEKIRVAFGTSIAGISIPPTALALEKKLSNGEFSKETALRDDGIEPDTKAGDGLYSGMLELSSEKETELYFRVAADYSGKTVTSEAAVFPITTLMTRARPSTGDLVITKDRRDKVYNNEVILSTVAGVSPKRVQTIISKVRDSLGPLLETIKIVGYIPSIDAYLVEFKWHESFKWYEIFKWHESFKWHKSLDGVKTVMESFKEYEEIESVSANAQITPAAASTGKWYLDQIGIGKLRGGVEPPPVYGSNSIGVAILDRGVDCHSPLLPGNCAPPPADPSVCPEVLLENPDPEHGTRVAALVAGRGDSVGNVAEGVAWKTTLFPINVSDNHWGLYGAIDCALALKLRSNIHILNVSAEGNGNTPLRKSVCNAVCNKLLLVASAGNHACEAELPRYPASYNDNLSCCGMEHPETAKRILSVGGIDHNGKRGDSCSSSEDLESQVGEIWAPGWGIPAPNALAPNGTSWSAALVSGCAAVHAAFQKWEWERNNPTTGWTWDPVDVHNKLMGKTDLVEGRKHLNCSTGSK